MKQLEELKKEYSIMCEKENDCYTYRGLLGWLEDKGLKINYHKGMTLGLLEFNNNISKMLNEDK